MKYRDSDPNMGDERLRLTSKEPVTAQVAQARRWQVVGEMQKGVRDEKAEQVQRGKRESAERKRKNQSHLTPLTHSTFLSFSFFHVVMLHVKLFGVSYY